MSDPAQVLSLADRCVKCGLCLPHCPTYGASLDENESPRGRIALLQGVAAGAIAPDEALRSHLDACLGCRRCERVCPAGVAFERVMDAGRQLPGVSRNAGWQRVALRWLGSPAAMRRLHAGLRLAQHIGLHRLLRRTGLLRRLGLDAAAGLLPPLQGPARVPPQPVEPGRETVGLLVGCLGNNLEAATVNAAVRVLQALGFGVRLLEGGCCGALAWHRGEAEIALDQARRQLAAAADGPETLLYISTGCGAHLAGYGDLPFGDAAMQERARRLANRVEEITAFLARQDWPEDIWKPDLPQRTVAVHTPCSQVNGLRLPDVASELLARLPGVRVPPLPGNERCCGAGGDRMLGPDAVSEALRGDKLEAIATLAPDVVASTNPGCALYLNAGLGYDQPLRVVHPVVVMAERLRPVADRE